MKFKILSSFVAEHFKKFESMFQCIERAAKSFMESIKTHWMQMITLLSAVKRARNFSKFFVHTNRSHNSIWNEEQIQK